MRKTLLLTLLTCWVSLVTAFAAEEHYTIMFKTGTNTQTTLKTTDAASAYIESGAEFISAPSAITNVIPETDKGLSIGSNNNKGSLTLTLSDAGKKEITKIVLKSAQSKSGTITLTVNGVAASATNTASDLQYVFTAPALQSTITIDATKKSYILGMEVYYEGSETPDPATVATPEFTPAGGDITPETEISLSCATEGATIWWQNGDAEATEYTAPFTLPEGTHTLTAWAVKEEMTNSAVATASFTVKNTVTPPIHAESYKIVTDPSQLVIGAKYIFVASREAGDEIPAMSTTQNKNNRGATNVKVNADLTVTPGTDVQLVTLESSSSTDYPYAFSLIDEDGNKQYLQGGGTSGTKNRLILSASMSDASNAKIDLTSTANPSITFNGGTYGNYLYYNQNTGGSPLVAAYQNKQTAANYKILYLYVDASVTPEEPKPVKLEKPEIEKSISGDQIVIYNPNGDGEVWYKMHANPVEETEEFHLYTNPISLQGMTTGVDFYVTAYVKSTDEVRFTDSDEAVFKFSIEEETPIVTLYAPVISPDGGEYEDSVFVNIDFAEENRELGSDYKIVYTLDGTEPDAESAVFTEAIELTEGEHTVRACVISVNADVLPGPTATATFNVISTQPVIPVEPVMGLGEATFDFTDAELCATYGFPDLPAGGAGANLHETIIENDGISMTTTNVSNGVKWWNGTGKAGLHLRMYKNNSVTFTMPGGMIETITVVKNTESDYSVSCTGTLLKTGTWAVNGETVTISAPSNGNVYVDRVIITYKPTTDNFAPGALFFEQEQAAGRVETDEDGNMTTTRELNFLGMMHPIYVRTTDAHLQDSEGMDIRLEFSDAAEQTINPSKAVASMSAKVKLCAETGKYHLLYATHEEHEAASTPVPTEMSLYDLMQEADANMHRYVKMAYVYYDAEAGTISFPAVPQENVSRVAAPENPSYTVKLSAEHNVQLPLASDYISLSGVLDKENGDYAFIPTLREVATGVQTVERGSTISVRGTSILAPEGSVVFSAAGVRVNATDLQPGLYLVVTPQGETAKCLIK